MTRGEPFAARSDVGLVREGNEDRYLAHPPVFAVADGMGGHLAGEVASALTVELLEAAASGPTVPDAAAIVGVLERSNKAIRERARNSPELEGMGTTCTAVVISSRAVEIAHVGDSRAYLLRAGVLRQLTEDHSLVATMVRDGLLTPAEASADERRNIVTRALGANDEVRVDRVTANLEPGDRLLLCSDGLSGQVTDAQIREVLASSPDAARVADRLIERSNAAGGDDNVTVVVIDPDGLPAVAAAAAGARPPAAARDVASRDDLSDGPPDRRGPRPTSVVMTGVIALAIFVAARGAMDGANGPSAAPSESASPSAATPSPSASATTTPSPSASASPSGASAAP